MPTNTNLAFREFGIALFFAAVGLGAGAGFLPQYSRTGLSWRLGGAQITCAHRLLVIFARGF
jgi:putative transport protein